jgi:hypothetical protein
MLGEQQIILELGILADRLGAAAPPNEFALGDPQVGLQGLPRFAWPQGDSVLASRSIRIAPAGPGNQTWSSRTRIMTKPARPLAMAGKPPAMLVSQRNRRKPAELAACLRAETRRELGPALVVEGHERAVECGIP